jgi:biotin operon repressor
MAEGESKMEYMIWENMKSFEEEGLPFVSEREGQQMPAGD